MGFFTWRQTKKTRREVAGLRDDQAQQAATEAVEHSLALFRQLPPEGKEEYRALEDECAPKWSDGPIQQRRKQRKLADGWEDILRRHDLIP